MILVLEIVVGHFGKIVSELGLDCDGLCGFGLVGCLGLFDVGCLLAIFVMNICSLHSNFAYRNFQMMVAFREFYF